MMTTGRDVLSSVSAKVLPRFTGILNTSKYPDETLSPRGSSSNGSVLLQRPSHDVERQSITAL